MDGTECLPREGLGQSGDLAFLLGIGGLEGGLEETQRSPQGAGG